MDWKARCSKPRRSAVTVDVYVGPTGSGKSKEADSLFPNAYWKPNGKWWPMYEGESTVVWDDFDPKQMPFRDLLRILDRYPLQVEFKGGYCQLQATHFVITTVLDPSTWYPDHFETGDMQQLHRRITLVRRFHTVPHSIV